MDVKSVDEQDFRPGFFKWVGLDFLPKVCGSKGKIFSRSCLQTWLPCWDGVYRRYSSWSCSSLSSQAKLRLIPCTFAKYFVERQKYQRLWDGLLGSMSFLEHKELSQKPWSGVCLDQCIFVRGWLHWNFAGLGKWQHDARPHKCCWRFVPCLQYLNHRPSCFFLNVFLVLILRCWLIGSWICRLWITQVLGLRFGGFLLVALTCNSFSSMILGVLTCDFIGFFANIDRWCFSHSGAVLALSAPNSAQRATLTGHSSKWAIA